VKPDKVFIIGCGRSGTHWVARAVASASGYAGTISDMDGVPSDVGKPLWQVRKLCEKFAYNPMSITKVDVAKVHALYQHLHEMYARGQCYVDKTHGFIWAAEVLAELFPNALFVGTQRSVFPSVASLLYREGSMRARRAGNRWRAFPVPNGPSGITTRIAAECYSGLTMPERAALLWKSHVCKMERVKKNLGSRLLLVNFEETLKSPIAETGKHLSEFIGAGSPCRFKEPRPAVNERWREEFREHEITKIARVATGEYYERECSALAFWHEKALAEVLG
jgi:hypothetical protein